MLEIICASLLLPLLIQFFLLLVPASSILYWFIWILLSATLGALFIRNVKKIFFEFGFFVLLLLVITFSVASWIQFYPTGEHVRDYNLISSSINNPLNPMDPWLSGVANHYYIFWFKWAASLHYLFGSSTEMTYVLGLALSFSFYVTLLFILFSRIFAITNFRSVLLSLSVAFISNLDGLLFYFRDGHWWGPSRVIKGIINEFPVWSLYQADFHPQFMTLSLPVLYLILSFLILRIKHTRAARLVLLTLLYGVFYRLFMLSNPWEVIFLTLAYPGFVLKEYFFPEEETYHLSNLELYVPMGLGTLVLMASFLYQPAYAADVKVKLVTSEIGRSHLGELFLHWGGWWIMAAVPLFISLFTKSYKFLKSDVFYFLVLAFLMLILPEIVYVDDSYGPPYERMNFMFKHYMPTWTVTGIAVALLWQRLFSKKVFWIIGLTFFLLGNFFTLKTYPIRAKEFAHLKTRLDHADLEMPGVKEAVLKFRQYPRGVTIQSSINPYDYTSFLGSLADKDLYLGWINHLLVLNRDYSILFERQKEIKSIYEEPLCEKKKEFVLKTKAKYLVYSLQERKDYPNSVSTDFSCFKEIIHEGYNYVFSVE